MKLIQDDPNTETIVAQASNFRFSGVRPESLGATEYTLATLVTDVTGSTSGFEDLILDMRRMVVDACKSNPRAEFLMLRATEFNTQVKETQGFKEVNSVDQGSWIATRAHGMTHLFDATAEAIEATNGYGEILSGQDFNVNGVIFVVTDGADTGSINTPATIKMLAEMGVKNEHLESLNIILIGVNAKDCKKQLEAFQNGAGLTQYVDAGNATPAELAKLAKFIAASISSQSQSLGTGGPSQALSF